MFQDLPCGKSENPGMQVKNFTFCFHFLMKLWDKLANRVQFLMKLMTFSVENKIWCQYILMKIAVSHMDIWSFFLYLAIKNIRHTPVSSLFHLFPLPRTFFLQTSVQITHNFLQISIKCHFLKEVPLIFYKMAWGLPPSKCYSLHHALFSPWLLSSYDIIYACLFMVCFFHRDLCSTKPELWQFCSCLLSPAPQNSVRHR